MVFDGWNGEISLGFLERVVGNLGRLQKVATICRQGKLIRSVLYTRKLQRPGSRVSRCDSAEGRLQLLVGPFDLLIGFRVVPEAEADPGSQYRAEGFPNL